MFKKLTIWDNLANIYPFWNKYTEPLPVDEANLTKWKQLWIWRNIYIETHNGNTILQHFWKIHTKHCGHHCNFYVIEITKEYTYTQISNIVGSVETNHK